MSKNVSKGLLSFLNDKLNIIFDDIEIYPKFLLDYLNGINPIEKFPKVNKSIIDFLNYSISISGIDKVKFICNSCNFS